RHPLVPVRVAVDGTHDPVGREPDPPRRGRIPGARADDSRPHDGEVLSPRASQSRARRLAAGPIDRRRDPDPGTDVDPRTDIPIGPRATATGPWHVVTGPGIDQRISAPRARVAGGAIITHTTT